MRDEMQDKIEVQKPDGASSSTVGSGEFGLLDIAVALAEGHRLLIAGPLVAAALAFGVTTFIPKTYTSVAYLALNAEKAQAAETMMRSPVILESLLKQHPDPKDAGTAPQQRLNSLRKAIKLSAPPGTSRKTASLFMLEVELRDPARAQAINKSLIEAWLEATKPKPLRKAELEEELSRAEAQFNSVSGLIQRFEEEAPKLVLPSSLQGQLATPLASLLQQRAALLKTVIELRRNLRGDNDRDVVFSPPTLPYEHSSPRRGFVTVVAALLTSAVLLLYVLLRHLIERSRGRPETAAKLDRIRAALIPWQRKR